MSRTHATHDPAAPRLVDGPVLVGNLVAGALLLLILAFLSWP